MARRAASGDGSSTPNQNTQKSQPAPPAVTPPPALRAAAAAFEEAVAAGLDPEEAAAAIAFGVADTGALSETQAKYKAAAAEKAALAAKAQLFEAGKKLYARGEYYESVRALDAALEREGGPMSALGGDIQLWRALALQASGEEEECISVYRALEASHPLPRIRKQAADLRFIMEAPKLKVGKDERVAMPDLSGLDPVSKAGERRRRPPPPPASVTIKKPARQPTWEERWAAEWKPPSLLKNKYAAVAAAVVGVGLAVYSALAK